MGLERRSICLAARDLYRRRLSGCCLGAGPLGRTWRRLGVARRPLAAVISLASGNKMRINATFCAALPLIMSACETPPLGPTIQV